MILKDRRTKMHELLIKSKDASVTVLTRNWTWDSLAQDECHPCWQLTADQNNILATLSHECLKRFMKIKCDFLCRYVRMNDTDSQLHTTNETTEHAENRNWFFRSEEGEDGERSWLRIFGIRKEFSGLTVFKEVKSELRNTILLS